MKTQDIKNMASAYMQVLEKAKMDKVNPKALEKDFDDRDDKDIDNDGDVDKSDEYLHNRRKAVKQAMKKEAKAYGPGHIGAVQKMLDKEREAKKAKDTMKKEEVEDLDEDISKMSHGRLKWHMNTGTPHGSYSNAEMKAERDRRMKYRDSADAYKKAKPGLSEAKDGDGANIVRDREFKGKSLLGKTPTPYKPANPAGAHYSTGKNTFAASAKKSMRKEEVEIDEAAPKIKPDFIKTQREKDRAHDAAMGRTPTGRKKVMTSTQRSLASMRKEEVNIDDTQIDEIFGSSKFAKGLRQKMGDASNKKMSDLNRRGHKENHDKHLSAAMNGSRDHNGHDGAYIQHRNAAEEHKGTPAGKHHAAAAASHDAAADHLDKYKKSGDVKHLNMAVKHSEAAVEHSKKADKAGGTNTDSHLVHSNTKSVMFHHKGMNEEFANMSMKEKLQLQKESILEREMTDAEKKKREDIVMGMKKNKADLEKRYGSRWKDVMYATATKQAMESVDNALAMTKNLLTTKESFKTETTTWPVYARIKEANDRAKHYKGATPPETMDDKLTASDKAFLAPHGELSGNDSGIDGAKAAEYTAKNATTGIKAGGGMNRTGDQNIGDKNIIKSTEAK